MTEAIAKDIVKSEVFNSVVMNRVWAMPSADTFTIPPIRDLLERYGVGKGWIDPFAGDFSPAEFTNDLNPNKKAKHHMDAVEFTHGAWGVFKGVCFDPPYSPRQMKEVYESIGIDFTKTNGQQAPHFAQVKNNLAHRVELAICCGWNSSGFGKSRGFELIELLIVNHGGNGHHDTIVTVEQKVENR